MGRVGAILPEDLDITISDLHNKIGNWTIKLSNEHPMAPALRTPGAGITVTAGGLTFSGPALQPEFEASSEDGLGNVTIKGVCDKVILADALAYPQPTNPDPSTQTVGSDEVTANAETLMHSYVGGNIGPYSPVERRNPYLTLGPNLSRGAVATKRPRFPVLGDLLNEIAAVDGLGYRVVQVGPSLEFRTYQTVDRRLGVRLSMFNGELATQKVATSAPGVTRVIVGGKGDLVARKFVASTSAESLAAEALWGRRIERFVDQRSDNLTSALQQAGQELLAEQGYTYASVQAIPSEDSSLTFGVDYGLGDLITIEVEGVESTSFVSGYVLQANSDGVRLGIVLGDEDDFNELGATQRQLETVTRQVSSLERNAEASAERGNIISRHHGHMVRLVSPAPGQWLSVHTYLPGVTIPAGARTATVSWSWGAHISTNGAVDWTGLVRFNNTPGTDVTVGVATTHNEGNPALNIGASVFGELDVTAYVGQTLGLYTNALNHAGSGAGLHPGWASFSITFKT